MNTSDLEVRTQYWYQRTAKYGNCRVPATTVHDIFEEVVHPQHLGFALIKKGLFGKQIANDIAHLLKFQAYKGAMYSFRWGVSLGYMPHEWKPKLKCHRSFASARFDLFEQPFDFLFTGTTPWRESETYGVDTLHGEICLREDLELAWKKTSPTVVTWLDSMQSPNGILQRAYEQMSRVWSGPLHHPDPAMVYAFTLAKIGRIGEALVVLHELMRKTGETPDAQERLDKAIHEIAVA
jgi:hypothetical protein